MITHHPFLFFLYFTLIFLPIPTLLGLYAFHTVQNQRHTYHLLINLTEKGVRFRWEWRWNRNVLETFPSQAQQQEEGGEDGPKGER